MVNAVIGQPAVRDSNIPMAQDRMWGRRQVGEKRGRWDPLLTLMETRAHSPIKRTGKLQSQVSSAVETQGG